MSLGVLTIAALLGAAVLAAGLLFRHLARRAARSSPVEGLGGELFAHAAEAILLVDAGGRVVEANARACRDLGRSAEQLAGLPLSEIEAEAGPPDGEAFRKQLGRATGPSLGWLRRADGSLLPVERRSVGVTLDGQPALLVLARDQSEARASELQLREHEEALERSRRLEAVGRMARGFAHDFNNLLVVITGLTDLVLERTPRESPLRRELHSIRAAAERAAELTRQLLVFARQQASRAEAVPLAERLPEVAGLLERLLGDGVSLRLELGDDLGRVRVDADQLEQALVDLVLAARDAAPGGAGQVRLAAARHGAEAQLRVIDASADPGERARLLQLAPHEGTLPGLAFVRCFAEQAGGSVEARAEPGVGTVVELRLPRVPD
jgi:PAS domain S-box-containing protein